MAENKRVRWENNLSRIDGICELTEVTQFDALTMNETELLINEPPLRNESISIIEDKVNNSLLASLASGIALQESLQYNNSDIEERIKEVDDLIFRLEDMAAVLKIQLHSARNTLQKKEEKPTKPIPFVIRYQLLFVLLFQGIILSLSALYDHLWKNGPMFCEVMVDVISTTLLIINALIVCAGTALLSKSMLKHNVDSIFMAQTYFSTVIVFSSLYFIIFRFEPESWEFSETDHIKTNGAFAQYIRMLYLSVSSATLCGAANIQPKSWYVTLMVCFQSLVNFVYFASILAQTIGNYNSYTVQIQRSQSITASNSFRQSGVRRSTISPQ